VLQQQLTKNLRQRLANPRVEPDRLSKFPDCYKIKLRNAGLRLVYQVHDQQVIIIVIAIGKRDSGKRDVYHEISGRIGNL
jgi:mRNA interferase RelE/StbE